MNDLMNDFLNYVSKTVLNTGIFKAGFFAKTQAYDADETAQKRRFRGGEAT